MLRGLAATTDLSGQRPTERPDTSPVGLAAGIGESAGGISIEANSELAGTRTSDISEPPRP